MEKKDKTAILKVDKDSLPILEFREEKRIFTKKK